MTSSQRKAQGLTVAEARKQQVSKYGAVMTPPKKVEQMLDMISEEKFADPGTRFVEPSCGTGNFVVGLFQRMVDAMIRAGMSRHDACITAVVRLRAADMQPEMVATTQVRLLKAVMANQDPNEPFSQGCVAALTRTVGAVIVCGDALKPEISAYLYAKVAQL